MASAAQLPLLNIQSIYVVAVYFEQSPVASQTPFGLREHLKRVSHLSSMIFAQFFNPQASLLQEQ